MKYNIGIDIGTRNVRMAVEGYGIAFCASSAVAVQKGDEMALSAGLWQNAATISEVESVVHLGAEGTDALRRKGGTSPVDVNGYEFEIGMSGQKTEDDPLVFYRRYMIQIYQYACPALYKSAVFDQFAYRFRKGAAYGCAFDLNTVCQMIYKVSV